MRGHRVQPSELFYYAVHSNTGQNAAEKNLAAGLAVMKQDIVCSRGTRKWAARPLTIPIRFFRRALTSGRTEVRSCWRLVEKQAGAAKPLEESLFALAHIEQVEEFVPSAEDLKLLRGVFTQKARNILCSHAFFGMPALILRKHPRKVGRHLCTPNARNREHLNSSDHFFAGRTHGPRASRAAVVQLQTDPKSRSI
jgi:hypothetical protein